MNVVESLLGALCVQLGFCLSPDESQAIVANPPRGVEAMARRVWEAEGMGVPTEGDPLFRRLCTAVCTFSRTGSFRVQWPDGVLVAEVHLDPACRPLETGSVIGSYAPGPGFERLASELDDAESPNAEASAPTPGVIDDLGLSALDGLGREYPVCDLVCAEGQLQFTVTPLWRPS